MLEAARGYADQIADAELGLMIAALEWAHRNPSPELDERTAIVSINPDDEVVEWEKFAHDGCPVVERMSIPEFAYAAGMSERVATTLIYDATLMFYRFPRTWARMVAGHVPVWRARLVPRNGIGQPDEVARYVDRHLAEPGARFTASNVQRLIDEARLRFVPEEVAREQAAREEERGAWINTRDDAARGLAVFGGCLELPDALDLEAALSYGAARLKELGSTDPLDVRRAQALGDLARAAQTPLVGSGEERPKWDGTGVPRTGAKVYIHLNHTALRCTCTAPPAPPPPGDPPPGPREDDRLGEVARVDGTGVPTTVLSPDVVRRWFTRPTRGGPDAGPKITITRVIDADDYLHSRAYEIPERVRTAAALRDRSCVFPFCHALAERSDCDHTIPFDEGGPTCTCNLAPLCRSHHRLKTHGQHSDAHRWTYTGLGGGRYVWSGPNGIHLLRTPRGSHPLAADLFATRLIDGAPTPGVLNPDGTFTALTEDHAAFDILTLGLALPRVDAQGAPRPVSGEARQEQAERMIAEGNGAPVLYQRYVARGKNLLRPVTERYAPTIPPDDPEFAPEVAPPPVNPFDDEGPAPF